MSRQERLPADVDARVRAAVLEYVLETRPKGWRVLCDELAGVHASALAEAYELARIDQTDGGTPLLVQAFAASLPQQQPNPSGASWSSAPHPSAAAILAQGAFMHAEEDLGPIAKPSGTFVFFDDGPCGAGYYREEAADAEAADEEAADAEAADAEAADAEAAGGADEQPGDAAESGSESMTDDEECEAGAMAAAAAAAAAAVVVVVGDEADDEDDGVGVEDEAADGVWASADVEEEEEEVVTQKGLPEPEERGEEGPQQDVPPPPPAHASPRVPTVAVEPLDESDPIECSSIEASGRAVARSGGEDPGSPRPGAGAQLPTSLLDGAERCRQALSEAQAQQASNLKPVGGKRQRMHRVAWTAEEVAELRRGVEMHSAGRWAHILKKCRFHPNRTAVDIKDKWRNLQKEEAAMAAAAAAPPPASRLGTLEMGPSAPDAAGVPAAPAEVDPAAGVGGDSFVPQVPQHVQPIVEV